MRQLFKSFACLLTGMLTCSCACADEMHYWTPEKPLYDFDAGSLSGSLCWNTHTGDPLLYDYAEYDEQMTTVNLSSGEVSKLPCPGYIIDRDDREYPGALFAKEQDGLLTIIHQNDADSGETVYQGPAPQPVEYMGRQTIRAYMGGYLYYLKALEDNDIRDISISDTTEGGDLHIARPNPVSARLCRLGPDGDVYEYGLIGTYDSDRTPNYDQSIIDGYAIHPNGAVAWIEVDYDEAADQYRNRIWVETPKSGRRIAIDSASVQEMGYPMIAQNGICWLSERELLFFAQTDTAEGSIYTLLKADIENDSVVEWSQSSGEAVQTSAPPIYGSNMVLSPDRNELAYLTWSNWWNYTAAPAASNWDVPMIIDLRTGEHFYVYGYPDEWENRASRWRISWYEPSK